MGLREAVLEVGKIDLKDGNLESMGDNGKDRDRGKAWDEGSDLGKWISGA